ncbi:MAG: hypothetical protein ACLTSZ_11735 [Lachnospiraceae bacterium]
MDFRLVQAPEGYGFGFTELLKERGYHCEGGIEVDLAGGSYERRSALHMRMERQRLRHQKRHFCSVG